MEYGELYEKFIQDLKDKYEQTKKADLKNYTNMLTRTEYIVHGNKLSSPKSMKVALKEYEKFIKEYRYAYISIETEIEYDIEASPIGIDEVEIENTESHLVTRILRPFTEEEFNNLITDNNKKINNLFRGYINDTIRKDYCSDKSYYYANVDCKIIELYKNKILTFDQLVKTTLSNCKVKRIRNG